MAWTETEWCVGTIVVCFWYGLLTCRQTLVRVDMQPGSPGLEMIKSLVLCLMVTARRSMTSLAWQ